MTSLDILDRITELLTSVPAKSSDVVFIATFDLRKDLADEVEELLRGTALQYWFDDCGKLSVMIPTHQP